MDMFFLAVGFDYFHSDFCPDLHILFHDLRIYPHMRDRFGFSMFFSKNFYLLRFRSKLNKCSGQIWEQEYSYRLRASMILAYIVAFLAM